VLVNVSRIVRSCFTGMGSKVYGSRFGGFERSQELKSYESYRFLPGVSRGAGGAFAATEAAVVETTAGRSARRRMWCEASVRYRAGVECTLLFRRCTCALRAVCRCSA
jgi:hypothetical protein